MPLEFQYIMLSQSRIYTWCNSLRVTATWGKSAHFQTIDLKLQGGCNVVFNLSQCHVVTIIVSFINAERQL